MNYSEIRQMDVSNGLGIRCSLFCSGCNHHCKNCFNQETWDFNYGSEFTDEVLNKLLDYMNNSWCSGLSILGGEPLDKKNRKRILDLIVACRKKYANTKTIWLWTGYVYDDLIKENDPIINEIFNNIDVLIDGPFIEEQKDLSLKYRGSANQRVISLSKVKSIKID